MKAMNCELPVTVSVPDYGAVALELGRNSSYVAAKAGVFPTIEVQGKKRVPLRKALRLLAGDDPSDLEAVARDFLSKLRKRAA
jgi:hypothetical protein